MAIVLGYIYQSPSSTDPAGVYPYYSFTASCSGSVINVSVASALPILPGQPISGAGIATGTIVLWQVSGTAGGVGLYQLSTTPGALSSQTMYNTLGNSLYLETGGGNIWYQTDTGNYLVRNSTGTGWTLLGDGDLIGLGMLAQSGGAMGGTITGSTLVTADGLTAIAKPPEALAQNSLIASMADLQALETYLVSLIQTTVQQALPTAAPPGLRANMVFAFGTAGPAVGGSTVPVNLNTIVTSLGLTYQDGTVVQPGDCQGFATINVSAPGTGTSLVTNLSMALGETKGMQWVAWYNSNTVQAATTFDYMIIAIKPTAQ